MFIFNIVENILHSAILKYKILCGGHCIGIALRYII